MLFALFHLAAVPGWPGAPEWLTTRVAACAVVVVALAVLSLLLKGLQKVITLLIAATIVLGAVWLAQDAFGTRASILPAELEAELDGLAARALENPDAEAAWESAQKEWSRWTGEARAKLSAGGDEARAAVARQVEAKAAELRKQNKKAAADELLRLRNKVMPSGD